MNLFVEGNDRCLPSGMNWINEPAQWAFDGQGELMITAPPLADFFIDPNGTSVRRL